MEEGDCFGDLTLCTICVECVYVREGEKGGKE